MKAELAINEHGHAVLLLSDMTMADNMMLHRFRAFLPVKEHPTAPGWVITGDRMPGMGVSGQYLNAVESSDVSLSPQAAAKLAELRKGG